MSQNYPTRHRRDVEQYLRQHYQVENVNLKRILDRNEAEIDLAIKMGSFPYYPGDRIAVTENLIPMADDEDEEDEE